MWRKILALSLYLSAGVFGLHVEEHTELVCVAVAIVRSLKQLYIQYCWNCKTNLISIFHLNVYPVCNVHESVSLSFSLQLGIFSLFQLSLLLTRLAWLIFARRPRDVFFVGWKRIRIANMHEETSTKYVSICVCVFGATHNALASREIVFASTML